MNAEAPDYDALLDVAADYLRRVRDLLSSRGTKISTEGVFASLVVAFCWKQEDHADAILTLGRHRDVQLIARSMIEGLCQVKWAAQDPDTRAERWRQFAWIHDWRLLQRDERADKPVPLETEKRILQGVAQHGHLFLKGSARKKKEKAGRDPYVRHWSGRSVAELCEEVKGERLYEWPYASFSDWHHWSPGGIVPAFKEEGRKVTFDRATAHEVLPSFAVAFQCLYETIELANSSFALGADQDLEEIREGFLRDLKPAQTHSQSGVS